MVDGYTTKSLIIKERLTIEHRHRRWKQNSRNTDISVLLDANT